MKKIAIATALLTLLGAGAYFVVAEGPRSTDASNVSLIGDAVGPLEPQASDRPEGVESVAEAVGQIGAPASVGDASQKVVKSIGELTDRASLTSALSAEEHAWLRTRGYPSAWELENLDALDWAAIDRLAAQGDPVATALRAERALRSGDTAAAGSLFGVAKSQGSVYAAMQTALQHALAVDPAHVMSPQDAYMSFRLATALATQLGDHRAIEFANAHLQHLTAQERQSLDAATLRSLPAYFESWQDVMNRSGRRDLTVTQPRPNSEQWRAAQRGGQPSISIVQLPSRFRARLGG